MRRLAFLAYFKSVLVRSSIGGYVKSVRVDDPQSPYQRFGPPFLSNWLPDSGATSHYTPLFSDLRDVQPCSVPVSLADGSTKLSTHKGPTECHFTTDDGLQSILGLTDVYYVEGLSHRLLSLTALSCTQNFSVLIKNRAMKQQYV